VSLSSLSLSLDSLEVVCKLELARISRLSLDEYGFMKNSICALSIHTIT